MNENQSLKFIIGSRGSGKVLMAQKLIEKHEGKIVIVRKRDLPFYQMEVKK